MADITMCTDEACPKKTSCYRFTAPPSERQSYLLGTFRREGAEKCEYFMGYAVTQEEMEGAKKFVDEHPLKGK